MRADGYDTLPIAVGIVTYSILATRGSYIQFIGVGMTGTATTWYAKKRKKHYLKMRQMWIIKKIEVSNYVFSLAVI